MEIDDIADTTEFNTMKLLNGDWDITKKKVIQVGANEGQTMSVGIGSMKAATLKPSTSTLTGGVSTLTISGASPNFDQAIKRVDEALQFVSDSRADLGAYQNRLEFAVKGILVGYENMQAAESRIRDTDMAEQMSEFVKDQILTQSSVAMVGQANMKSQAVLRLLQF